MRRLRAETIAILEANLDDLSPQFIGYIMELALAEGALDVFTTPVQMKKNRPGTLLTVLARPENEEHLRALLFRESSTLGVRTRHEKRYALPRRHEAVATPWGEVRMKIASLNGADSHYAPEYEDCRRIAAEHHVAAEDGDAGSHSLVPGPKAWITRSPRSSTSPRPSIT